MGAEGWLFGVFGLVIVLFLIVDLGVFQKKSHRITFKSALIQCIFWFCVSVSFGALIWVYDSPDFALQFYTAYLTEYSLSIDNIFIFILIFKHFKVKEAYQHRILYWGVMGAFVFRGIFIGLGNIIVDKFHWVLYIFGGFLVYTGYNMLRAHKEEAFEPEKSPVYKLLNRYLRFVPGDGEGKFTTRVDGKLHFTMLFLVVVLIESADIVFAVDSIPAVFSVTQNPFVIFTSNIFAIMGLRAMYFMLESVMEKFAYLKHGVSFILIFIGIKMLLGLSHVIGLPHIKLPDWVSLVFIVFVITGSVFYSLYRARNQKAV